MKFTTRLFLILILTLNGLLFAQSPQSISYQAVLRDANGTILSNKAINIQISILQNTPTGMAVYEESHAPTTNDFGLINLNVGSGVVLSGDFTLIDWGGNAHFLKVELDENGTGNFLEIGTTQLLSVPYSLYAQKAGTAVNVDDADADATNELQILSKTADTVSLSNGGGFIIDSDSKLSEAEVDAFVANNGYLTTEVDGSITNELQSISKTGDTISLSKGGGFIIDTDTDTQLSEAEVDAFVANNGYLTTEVDGSVTNELQSISKAGDTISLSMGGGFIIDTDTDTQLSEAEVDAFVANNGYLTTEVDGSVTNELQSISKAGDTISLSMGGGFIIDTDTDTQLSEAEVDAFVANNGYLTTEIDGSITNELQSISKAGDTISLSKGGGFIIDTDTDTQLSEAEVDAFVANNGYLTTEVDGSVTNELQTLTKSGNTISLSNSGGAVTDNDTQLSEAQVDAFVANNGYLTTEVDGSVTNELQTLTKSGNTISLSNGGGSVTDDNTQLTEVQVDAFVANNGYLTTEIDGSITNELQTLSISNDTLMLSDGGFVKLPGATVPDTAQPVPIAYHGSQIYVHPTDNATNVDWSTAQTTCDNLLAFGFSDWVLPSRLELDAMYKQSYYITGLSQTDIVKYWSSTELDVSNAYSQRLDYGGPDPDPKTDFSGHNCRCIRR